MRILLVTRNLPPLVGGMERLNWHMADELSKNAEVMIIGPKGAAIVKPQSVELTEVPLKPLSLFLLVTFIKGLWVALRWKPDIILAGSGLTAPLVWVISKLCGAHSAAYLHGFDITVNHNLYRKLWRPMFKKLDRVIVNSSPTQTLAITAGISPNNISIVYPGVSLPEAAQTADSISAFKEKHGLQNQKILLSIGRLTTRKGLLEFVEQALPTIVQNEPSAMLVVVGEAPKNSLGAGIQSKESIQAQALRSGVDKHIKFFGVITDKTLLATVYEASDVHVFPVRHMPDDPEGFGMVAIEAAAHGLPTVAFATGGIVDAVRNGVSGYLVEKNNYAEFMERTIKILQSPIREEYIKEFSLLFAWKNFGTHIWNSLMLQQRNNVQKRKAHAVLDLSSRALKAKKIERLLELNKYDTKKALHVLEIGCGSGGIAHYFSNHTKLNCEVTGVDVQDNRLVTESYRFIMVDSVKLPFQNSSFDIVITNHVIEHVGERNYQFQHLKEIKRVLKNNGVCYFAVPNRWMLMEPHYKLIFLSWLPHSLRSRYLRWSGKGDHYDCEPLSLSDLEKMLTKLGIYFENISVPATRITFELEKPHRITTKLLRKTPDSFLNLFKPIIPTLIYKLKHKNE